MGAEGTARVAYDSDIKRKSWMREGLLRSASKSFWNQFTGSTFDSVVYQSKNENAKEGHTTVFDFDGYLVRGPKKGKETAYGNGEGKRKFSDKITVDRYRFPVDNGDEFDGVDIGDLNITQHQDSRSKLSDLWVRFKDQALFDAGQQAATHVIASTTFTFDDFLDVENIIKTGEGYTTGAKRLPLKPFMMKDGTPVWLMIIDSNIKTKLMKSSGAQSMFASADKRGDENRLIRGNLGKIGNFLVVEADTFFGEQNGSILDTDGYSAMNNVEELIFAGLRQYKDDGTNFVPDLWTGDTGFSANAENLTSRGLIMGAGALQTGYGKMPDYSWQKSEDFGITSESLLEVWCNTQATILTAENTDYSVAEASITSGIVALDIQV